MTERQFQRAAVEYLTLALRPYGGIVVVIPGGDRQATRAPGYVSGEPDIAIIARGQIFGIELKTKRGRVKAHQEARHKAWSYAGAEVFIARSLDDLQGIVAALVVGRVRGEAA